MPARTRLDSSANRIHICECTACVCMEIDIRDAGHVPSQEYRLIVDGELSDQVSSIFGGMSLTRSEGKTILEGPVRDQAELQGLLQRVSDLGLTLLSVKRSRARSSAT